MYRAIIQQRETLSSNLASTKDIIERETAKVASTSADVAPLTSQIAASDSDVTAVSVVSASDAGPADRGGTGCRTAEGCSGHVDQTPHDARSSAQEPIWQEEQAGRQGDCCSDTFGSRSGSGDEHRRTMHNNWASSSCLVAPKLGVQSS